MKVIVIGAGTAGLGAARELQDAKTEVLILEARDRLGGRLWTNREFADFPIEFGAEFVHGDTISTQPLVQQLGLKSVKWRKTDDSLVRLEDGRMFTMEEARRQDPQLDAVRAWRLPAIKPLVGGETFADFLRRAGFNPVQLQYVRRMFANAVGEDPEVLDAEQALNDLESYAGNDYRLLDGYDRMVELLARGLDIKLNQEVSSIDWRDGIAVQCKNGQTFQADAALITLPVGVLKSGTIRFTPHLPESKFAALQKLAMGAVSKIIFRFDRPVVKPGIGAIYSSKTPPMLWSPSVGRSNVKDCVWSCFFSGRFAEELYAKGEKGAIQHALETLRFELDDPKLTPAGAYFVRWRDDPFSLGGYSVCLPGGFPSRAKLGEPTPPLYWAGEATSPSSTVHGALDSGRRAAKEILQR